MCLQVRDLKTRAGELAEQLKTLEHRLIVEVVVNSSFLPMSQSYLWGWRS
jgi:hypothetical protein